ncbi:hypothetical protein AGOR_G00131350 [Albula goreensis]|uniref:[histone H3]-lysine(4) N-methyltransferase n=1 Tax=Albula goreensis TaxID=1534307 RepID=A0A8T3D3R3_9TELE|nr:hypothetical protein AGOR_G00131350 [Albula goreensis]
MLLSQQQQNAVKNLAQLQQQQQQQLPPQGFLPQPGQQQGDPGALTQPAAPQMAPTETQPSGAPRDGSQMQGVMDGLQQQQQLQGGMQSFPQEVPNPPTKEGGMLSPTRTPPQQPGASTPLPMQQHPGPTSDQQGVAMQQQQAAFMNQQQQQASQQLQQQPHQQQLADLQQQQHSYMATQQLPLQRQNSLGGEKQVTVKQEGQQMCYMAQQQQQQQQQQGVMAGQQHDSMAQLQGMMGQATPAQAQPGVMVHPNQQQQQRLGQMGGVMRAQGMMGQRPGAPMGPIRTPINIQAILAQNPQLRHLPPSQQIQHIQAMLAQRQMQQGQMLRQVRPQVGPRMLGPDGQPIHHGTMGAPQQQGMMGQPPGMAPQQQQPGMIGSPQQPQQGMMSQSPNAQHQIGQQGVSPQYGLSVAQQQQAMQQQMMRGQPGQMMRIMPQGRPVRPMSPRQPFGQGSPSDPAFTQQRHALGQPGGIRQPSPTQGLQHHQQPHTPAGSSPFQASHTPVGSPAGMTRPGSSDSSLFSPMVQKQESGASPCPGADQGASSFPTHTSSPSKTIPLTMSKSPGQSGQMKAEPQGLERLGSGACQANGPSPQQGVQPEGEGMQGQRVGPSGEVCGVTLQNIKQEPREEQCGAGGGDEARTGAVKREASGEPIAPGNVAGGPQGPRAETGQQLLQKLLRTKNLQLAAQRPSDGVHSEINGHINSKLAMLEQKLQGTPRNMEDLQSITKKPPVVKAKRTPKVGGGVPNSRKKTKKEETGKSTEALMKQLKQELSLLPLMEPSITASLDLFAPFGSSPTNGKAQLKGSFGNAVLDNIPDYYSQLLTKSNLSNPPTPPSSLPPTPPPSVQHKLLNGLTAVEELPEGQKEGERETTDEAMESSAEEVKNVDLLAALPTPPHNQNEDIRMESDEDSDAPDSIVPASSPESVLGDEAPRFPLLGKVKQEEDERAISPIIPIIPRSSIPTFPETKPFEGLSSFPDHAGKTASKTNPWDKSKSSEVSVTFTLSAAAAKNLNTVMVAVAQLLQVRMPGSYEVAFPQSPGRAGVSEPGKAPDAAAGALGLKPGTTETEGSDQDAADWLKKFDVSLPGCTLKKQVDILSLIKQECVEPEDRAVQHCYITNVSDLDVRQLPIYPVEAPASVQIKTEPDQECGLPPPASDPAAPPVPSSSSPPPSPSTTPVAQAPPLVPALESPPKPCKQRSRRPSEDEELVRPKPKKWKGLRWKRLQLVITIRKGGSKRESGREVSELMERLRITLRPDKLPRDKRKCCFCHEEGDGATDGPARLLNIDVDLWVHLNCALWSTEVYETQGGALINVEVALRRGLRTRCAFCQKTGATNSCNRLRCPNVYHFACAIRARCMFFKDKTMLCTQHKLKGPSEEELSSFAVFRRVYIERDEVKQIASILQRGDRVHMFRVGGLIFHAVGQLLPSQMANFHSPTAIFPVGYEATRIYWSTRVPNRRCRYRCRISEAEGRPLFEVRVLEQGQEDLHFRDTSPDGIWKKVVDQVAKLREEAAMLKLFTDHVKGEEMYGLTLHAVLRITESLPGVENCQNYVFRYGRHPLMELPLMINPTGCARSEPKILTHCKRPHTLNSTSMSKAYQSTFTGEINTPYSKQFVHSKSSQYRRLKTEWKNNVYLARSRIQGLGLYAAKDLEKHTMVIEYIGTIIRNEVANRREKIYEEQNRGIYMFRINNEHVIDATLTGGPARYVNHSCAPNCVAEVVTFDKEDKIIIISSRRIPKGEELTYDYQFDFEDDQHKIPCHCGAWNCRKWMN